MACKTNWPPLSGFPSGKTVLFGSSMFRGVGADINVEQSFAITVMATVGF